jgi:hypothetical protein
LKEIGISQNVENNNNYVKDVLKEHKIPKLLATGISDYFIISSLI